MFSNDYKNEMIKKFNLTESLINSSKHYKIPKFVFKARNGINEQCKYHHPTNSLFKLQIQSHPELLLDKTSQVSKLSKTHYSENKKKKINNLMKKIQREKIDLLINRAYQQINNNIRKYNKSVSYPKKQGRYILKAIPLVTREFIIEHVMGQVEKYLPYQKKNIFNNTFENNELNKYKILYNGKLNKQFIWSHNFMEEKKMDDYKKKYRIKFIKTENKTKNCKLKKERYIKDKSLPEIKRIRTNMFFSSQKI
jgi:hypothetical protein